MMDVVVIFQYTDRVSINNGKVIYRKDESSFDFEPTLSADFTLMVGYLNITFNSESKLARQVWGLNPLNTWSEELLILPSFKQGGLLLVDEVEIESGECERIVEVNEWKTFYDKNSGWVCIGNPLHEMNDFAVEFATNTIALLSNSKLKSLWLKPVFI